MVEHISIPSTRKLKMKILSKYGMGLDLPYLFRYQFLYHIVILGAHCDIYKTFYSIL
jgi:hypothetical protein